MTMKTPAGPTAPALDIDGIRRISSAYILGAQAVLLVLVGSIGFGRDFGMLPGLASMIMIAGAALTLRMNPEAPWTRNLLATRWGR